MSRDDGVLWGGSAASRKVVQKHQERSQERQEHKNQLSPAEEKIFAEFDRLKGEIRAELVNTISPDTADDNVKAKLLATRMTLEHVSRLRTRISNILRPTKNGQKKQEETWGYEDD